MTISVTNKLVTVTGVVIQDILIVTVTKSVHRDILDWTAETVVAVIVQTVNHVIISVDLAPMVVRTVLSKHIVTIPVRKDILAQTVHGNVHLTVSQTHVYTQMDRVGVLQDGLVIIVPQLVMMDILAHTAYGNVHLTVSLAHVDTLTEGVLVMLVGWDIIVPKHVSSLTEKIVSTLAVCNVIITFVTNLMDNAFLVVKMDFMVNCVLEKICREIRICPVPACWLLDCQFPY